MHPFCGKRFALGIEIRCWCILVVRFRFLFMPFCMCHTSAKWWSLALLVRIWLFLDGYIAGSVVGLCLSLWTTVCQLVRITQNTSSQRPASCVIGAGVISGGAGGIDDDGARLEQSTHRTRQTLKPKFKVCCPGQQRVQSSIENAVHSLRFQK